MPKTRFIPREGQVDYTNIRYCPVVNCVVKHKGKILLIKRSASLQLYPGYWGTIDGFLDDNKSIEEKVAEELEEELSIKYGDIAALTRGSPLVIEGPTYSKTWLVIPVLAEVKTGKFMLSSEAETAKWLAPEELSTVKQVPNQELIIAQFEATLTTHRQKN